MPVVFIHGVNTREGKKYNSILEHLTSQIEARVLTPLGWPDVKVVAPYWGRFGVDFHWRPEIDLQVIPKMSIFEHNASAGQVLTGVEAQAAQNELADLSAADRQVILAAIETVLRDDAAMQSAVFDQPTEAEAAKALSAALDERVEDQRPATQGSTHFEGVQIPIVSAVAHRVLRIATAIASNRLRQRLQVNLSRFMGDAFVYARDRGTPEKPGEIIKTVAGALREAKANAKSKDEPMIVITYSMGGNIFNDIATSFDEEAAACTAWIAVGSQVAHFEDMKLFYASDKNVRYPTRLEKPKQIKYWFNLFDALDPCAFAAERVFKGVQDVRYSTGVSAFMVHGAYWEQPQFYLKIHELLQPVAAKLRNAPSAE